MDAGGTRLRLRALHVMGHGSARIARAAGASDKTIRTLVRGDTTTITPKLRDAIIAVYDAWWDKRAPERTPAERGAATAARKRAIAGNWCAAAALDDDQLDTPGYRPRQGWKPATGTGIAPDIYPPARTSRKGARMTDDARMNLGLHLRGPRRPGPARLPPQRQPAHRPGHRTARQSGPHLRGHHGRSPCAHSWCPIQAAAQPPGQPITMPSSCQAAEVKTIVAALDEAALYKRDRAAICTDCADQSCGTCQWRLQAASAYDQLTARLLDTPRPPATSQPPGPEQHIGQPASRTKPTRKRANDRPCTAEHGEPAAAAPDGSRPPTT